MHKDEDRGAHQGTGRFVRILTHDKPLEDIEGDILQAIGNGARALMSTAEGLSSIDRGSDSRSAAIAEWADRLAREHGLEWRLVGRDVLFATLR